MSEGCAQENPASEAPDDEDDELPPDDEVEDDAPPEELLDAPELLLDELLLDELPVPSSLVGALTFSSSHAVNASVAPMDATRTRPTRRSEKKAMSSLYCMAQWEANGPAM